MKKNIIFMIFILLFCAAASMAQFIPPGEQTGSTKNPAGKQEKKSGSIEGALKSYLFVIQQNYQLKDISAKKNIFGQNKLYGKDGKPNFGTIYTFGVKTSGGFYSNAKVVFPWLYDSDFEEYKLKTQYEPVISKTNYKKWDGKEYAKLKYSPKQIVWDSDSLVFAGSKMFGKIGFGTDVTNGKKKGWFVWILLNDEESPDAFSFEIVTAEHNFDSKNTTSEITTVPLSNKTIEGGLFVTERITEIGQIALDVSGFLFKKENKWYIKQPVLNKKGGSEKNAPDQKGLTPAN